MKKLLFSGVISLTLLAGSVFAQQDWHRYRDRDDTHRRVVVVRTNDNDRNWRQRRHARVFRTRDGRVIVVNRRHARVYRYYDRQHRIP